MNVGDTVTIPFGKGKKEGVVARISGKTVWVKVDFPRHPGKLIRRKIHQLNEKVTRKKGKAS